MRPTHPALLLALSLAFGATAQPITPDAQQNRSDQKAVNQLYRELTGTSPAAPAPPVSLGPPMSQEAGAENQLYRELTGTSPAAPAPPVPLGPPMSQEAGAENQLYRELTGSAPSR